MLEKKSAFTLFVDIDSRMFKVLLQTGQNSSKYCHNIKAEWAALLLFPVVPLQDGDADLGEKAPQQLFYKIHILKLE